MYLWMWQVRNADSRFVLILILELYNFYFSSLDYNFAVPSAFQVLIYTKKTTISTQIIDRLLIKIIGFYGGGLLQFLPQKSPKKPQKGDFWLKKVAAY